MAPRLVGSPDTIFCFAEAWARDEPKENSWQCSTSGPFSIVNRFPRGAAIVVIGGENNRE